MRDIQHILSSRLLEQYGLSPTLCSMMSAYANLIALNYCSKLLKSLTKKRHRAYRGRSITHEPMQRAAFWALAAAACRSPARSRLLQPGLGGTKLAQQVASCTSARFVLVHICRYQHGERSASRTEHDTMDTAKGYVCYLCGPVRSGTTERSDKTSLQNCRQACWYDARCCSRLRLPWHSATWLEWPCMQLMCWSA
jgi:hypothetical protein